MLRYLIPICVMLLSVNAFAPAAPQIASFRPASCIAAAKPPRALTNTAFVLRMSSENGEKEVSKISEDGTFYDDELDSAPKKSGISDSMKARLTAEASTGLDSEKKQTNTILYISGVVAVLVVLGGAGILY